MVRRLLAYVLILLLGAAYIYFFIQKHEVKPEVRILFQKTNHYEGIGEKIIYDLRLGLVKMGRATFRRMKNIELDGRQAALMTFETKLSGFYDLEEIYSDTATLLPIQVRRNIKMLGAYEKITENYDQKKFVMTLMKVKGGKSTEAKIQAKGTINNAISLPFYLRMIPELKIGWSLAVRLPAEFQVRLVSMEDVVVPAGKFNAYHFRSSPKNFDIWISADQCRIPIKIKSNLNTMVMKEYSAS